MIIPILFAIIFSGVVIVDQADKVDHAQELSRVYKAERDVAEQELYECGTPEAKRICPPNHNPPCEKP
jgi:hypothetical protein